MSKDVVEDVTVDPAGAVSDECDPMARAIPVSTDHHDAATLSELKSA